jgi:hypothetical protein
LSYWQEQIIYNKIRFDRVLKESKIKEIIFEESILKKLFFLVFLTAVSAFSCGDVMTRTETVLSEGEITDTENEDDNQIEPDGKIADEDILKSDEVSDLDVEEGFCGDDSVNRNEVCDGGSKLCSELGEGSGIAFCKSDCSGWDTESCQKTASRVDFSGPDYEGDTILVFNNSHDGDSSSFSGTFTENPVASPKIEKNGKDPFLRSDLRPPMPGIGSPSWLSDTRKIPIKPAAFVLGDTDTFYMYDFSSGNSEPVTAELKYVGKEIEIWLVSGESFSSTSIQAIANEFDSVIFDLVTTNFYAQPDVDGNGKVSLILGDLGRFAAGYISPADFYSKDEYEYSNFRDLIYIESSMGVSEIYSTLTHEFQHLCHNNRNLLVENDWYSGDLYYRWIDEGLAMAAQQMYEGAQQDMLYVANDSSYNSSVRDGNSFLYWDYNDTDKVYSDYAMAYLFFQYLRIQAGDDTSIYRDIISCTVNDYTCVEDIIKDKVDTEYDLGQFMVDFRIALILEDSTGPYGFGGESAFKFTMPYFTGSSASLRGGGGLYLKSSSTFTQPADAGNNIIFVGIDSK